MGQFKKLLLCGFLLLNIILNFHLDETENVGPTALFGQEHPISFEHLVIDSAPLATDRINDIQIVDIDDDGKPDIWVSGRGAGSDVFQMVWYKNPNWQRFPIAKGDFKYGDLGDFDMDGDLDVVTNEFWFENPGNARQAGWPSHPLGYTDIPDLIHVGDIDEDGRPDIVYKTKNSAVWLRVAADPKQPWQSFLIWEGGKRTRGGLADIDLDGDLDVLYGNAWFENPVDPTGIPWPMHIIDQQWPAEARGVAADFDQDGAMDIVLTDEEGGQGVALYRNLNDPALDPWTKSLILSGYTGVHSWPGRRFQ